MTQKIVKVIATVLMAYLMIMTVTIILGNMADEGVILDAWYSILEYIPFGNVWAKACVTIFGEFFNMANSLSQYLSGIKTITFLDVFEDTARLILTAVFFEAVNYFFQTIMGIKGHGGLHNVLRKMISEMVSVLLATFIAAICLRTLCSQMALLPGAIQGSISILITIITVSGAIGVLYFVLAVGIIKTVIYTLVDIVFINILEVSATYIAMLLMLLFLSEKAYLKISFVFASWGIVIILLVGADILLSSIFDL